MKAIVQISLDITNIDEALETAALAMRAGIDWLEAGPPHQSGYSTPSLKKKVSWFVDGNSMQIFPSTTETKSGVTNPFTIEATFRIGSEPK